MRHRLEHAAVAVVAAIVRVLPISLVRGLGALLGLTFYTLDRAHRRIAERNLATAFPARTTHERRAIARGAFTHFGRLLLELLKFSTLSPEARWIAVEFDGEDRARIAYAQGKGVLFFTGHFGYWELHAIAPRSADRADRRARARARQPDSERRAGEVRRATGNYGDLPSGADPPRDADAARRPRHRAADRSAHSRPRRHLRGLLRAAGGDDLGAGGAGAAHRRAGRAGVRAAARRRPLSYDLRASGRAAAGRQRPGDARIHAAVHGCARDVRPSASGPLVVDAPAVARRRTVARSVCPGCSPSR